MNISYKYKTKHIKLKRFNGKIFPVFFFTDIDCPEESVFGIIGVRIDALPYGISRLRVFMRNATKPISSTFRHNQRNCHVVSPLIAFVSCPEPAPVGHRTIFHFAFSLFPFLFQLQDARALLTLEISQTYRETTIFTLVGCDKALFSVSGSYTRNCENDKHNWEGGSGRDGVLLLLRSSLISNTFNN